MSAAHLLLMLVTAVALIGGGYRWGAVETDERWQLARAQDRDAAHELFRREVKRGSERAALAAQQIDAQRLNYVSLKGKFDELQRNQTPLVVAMAGAVGEGVCPPGQSGSGAANARPPPEPPAVSAQAPGASVPQRPAAINGLRVTHGAVWVWNSALFGADSPSGACSAADTSQRACAPASGITLDAAFANHAVNAELCAQDRLRHQHLIDFIKSTQPAP